MGSSVWFALALSALAGLATTIGSVLGLVVRKPGPRFMALSLGFSAGVMVLVSFVELLPSGIETAGFPAGMMSFFGGMVLMLLLDFLIPHQYKGEKSDGLRKPGSPVLMRTGLLVALGIGIHNLPEGMAAFAGALQDVRLGVAIAVAIGIHNIPEGLAVSVPVYAASGSRKKAFIWSFLSGVTEPLGAALGAFLFMPFLTPVVLGCVLAGVAGIMVFISFDELVPVANSYGHEHLAVVGTIAGMTVMALSLWLLG
ncbi:zinc transporter ZupT [candidate division WOR-3 bacterium]|nr:zinc transporter ZupT [candidate division WOR-3 bacterium]